MVDPLGCEFNGTTGDMRGPARLFFEINIGEPSQAVFTSFADGETAQTSGVRFGQKMPEYPTAARL
jgi:hypothetical protein